METSITQVQSSGFTGDLSQLPHDVLLEILNTLSVRSIASFRQTCQLCYHLSKTRSVWVNAFHNLQNYIYGTKPRLERPIKTYSSTDLEEFVVRVIQLDANWTRSETEGGPKLRVRKFSRIFFIDALLVPGGRWLLLITNGDSHQLCAIDLDKPIIEKQILADLPEMSELGYVPNMCVSVVEGSPMFAFDLLVPCGGSPILMLFMRIVLQSDCTALRVENICRWNPRHPGIAIPPGCPMRDELLFHTLDDHEPLVTCAILEWRAGAESVTVFRLFTPNMPRAHSTPRDTPEPPLITPCWTHHFEHIYDENVTAIPMSIPFQASTQQLQFIVFTGNGVFYSVGIPDLDWSTGPIVRAHGSPFGFQAGFLGSRRGLLISESGDSPAQKWTCLTYASVSSSSSNTEEPSPWIVEERRCDTIQDAEMTFDAQYDWQFDESSGRLLVYVSDVDQPVHIADFV
ncbi:hypothetical protein FRB93_011003 [Tulasnella sp. JGI-2019a]|nr:hypothetical protein FRB93_011003 [Tulasnella sp. JGI-2019a]